jgi:predicted O-methyltransferase YrrM
MTDDLAFPPGDYVSPAFKRVRPDAHFPNMIVGDVAACPWAHLRRTRKHNWYVDRRIPNVGFVSRDEAHILYNCALQFAGKRALEIGCWLGWSACHLALAGVHLEVIDPLLSNETVRSSVASSLAPVKKQGMELHLIAGQSPSMVHELARQGPRWSFAFIDGNHEFPGPVNDAVAVESYCNADALILFHDLLSPHVAEGLRYFQYRGWQTTVFHTMQVMGAAWRGNVVIPPYVPDPAADWEIPDHLKNWA